MIIGINGKIGSGKDTVGKIIQYLQCYNVGDITIEDFINNPEHDWWIEEQCNFEIKKFAGKLKQTAFLLTGIPVETFEDQEFKKTYLGSEWGTVKTNPLNSIPVFKNIGFNQLMSVRELLQKLGTEAMRNGLHTNVWVNALFADYKEQPNKAVAEFLAAEGLSQSMNAGETELPNWIITDMRFPNEMEAVVEREGITIRVVRDNGTRALSDMNNHPSEISLDDSKFDYEIINDGSIEDLVEKVKEILTIEKII
jgi:hypothetical protein